ncbi:hypothetical protein BH11PSE13_BH11PSE13_19520 [soil metagenome]
MTEARCIQRMAAACGLALSLCPAFAADDAPRCNRNGNQMELNACAEQDFKASDQKLNDRYKALMTSLPAAGQTALRTEQRAWLKRRDPTCRARIQGLGSMAPLEYSACQQELTDKRVKQLEAKASSAK